MDSTPTLIALPAEFRTLHDAARLDAEKQPHSVHLNFADGHQASTELQTFVCSWWNLSALFFVFSGKYRGPDVEWAGELSHGSLRTPGLWKYADVVEVFIGRNAQQTGRYKEFEVAPDGRWIALDIRKESDEIVDNQEWPTAFQSLSVINRAAGSWRAAMLLPWEDLGGSPSEEDGYHCNLYRSIPPESGGYTLAWSPTGYGPHSFHSPENFGRLVLAR